MPQVRAVMLMDEFEENGKVCRKCGHHARLTAWERIRLTADPGSFRELDGSLMACDPIGFEDYPRKLENTRPGHRACWTPWSPGPVPSREALASSG